MNWSISSLDRSLPDGVVLTAHWRLTATEDGFTGSVYGTISFAAKDPKDPTFVPYDNLTEATVIQWVKDEMGGNQVAAYEAAVQGQIDKQKNPTSASGVPWTSSLQAA